MLCISFHSLHSFLSNVILCVCVQHIRMSIVRFKYTIPIPFNNCLHFFLTSSHYHGQSHIVCCINVKEKKDRKKKKIAHTNPNMFVWMAMCTFCFCMWSLCVARLILCVGRTPRDRYSMQMTTTQMQQYNESSSNERERERHWTTTEKLTEQITFDLN